MSTAPHFDIDLAAFSVDPYPALARMRREAPIAFVPQLNATLLTKRDDIFECEKNVEVFSSHQPGGLMNRLMGVNMMRKDGEAHMAERRAIFPTISPKTAAAHWRAQFQGHADRLLDALASSGRAELGAAFALPYSGECLKSVTGLTNVDARDIDAWSQAMIDGIANYARVPEIEQRCICATTAIDAAIDDMAPVLAKAPDLSLLGVMLGAKMPMESIKANIRLAISGGQNEPRHVILGCIWALLTHPEQLAAVRAGRISPLQVFEEFARWLSPIAMSPRRIAKAFTYHDVTFEPDERAFLMFGSANRDEAHFADAERFDATRDTSKSIPFGAGPHFCAGAFVARAMIADVALPTLLARLPDLVLDDSEPVRITGWAFRGLQNLPVTWRAS